MKKLSEKSKALLIMGVKTVGLEDALSFIEEQLTTPEYEALGGFLKWVGEDRDNHCFGHGNLDARYAQYLKSRVA